MTPRSLAAGALLATLCARAAGAQDFATPLPPGVEGPARFLERGLPPARAAPALELAALRWFGIPELDARAAAVSAGWRGARLAAGLSQTADPDLGWTAAGLAAGGAGSAGAAGLRLVARRDQAPGVRGPLGPGVGFEAGAGAWVEAANGLRAWACAPQLWKRGTAPPLERGLEAGVWLDAGDAALWIARRIGLAGDETEGGVAVRAGALAVWLRVRDHPLRGGIGLSGAGRGVRAAAAIDAHPVLGETSALGVLAGPP